MCPPDLPTLLERANTAWQQTWDALLALAKALAAWNSSSVPDPLAEVQAALSRAEYEKEQAQEVLKDLEDAMEDVPAPAEARGTLGDEDDKELWKNAKELEEVAKELEEQKERAKQWHKWLQTGHVLAMGLVALCGGLLSLESIRTALGVAEDNHVLLALGMVAVSCQVAAQALGTSWRQLHATAREHRDKAQKLYEHAQGVRTAKAKAKDATTNRGKIVSALRPLKEVTRWLGMLAATVNEDLETKVTPGQKFNEAENKLRIILKASEKASARHGDMAQRLQKARGVSVGQG
ncbi:hypothetical protein TURU_090960 [Turdus rufiventris]|nr:hypothetical protein TURU_090960 [Turdus rufiventris]